MLLMTTNQLLLVSTMRMEKKQVKVVKTDEVLNQLSSEARLLHTKVAYEAEWKGSMHKYTDA